MSADQAAQGRQLEELESRLAFLDDMVESLNQVVARQDKELLDLKRRLANTDRRLEDLGEAAATGAASAGHEVPPHY